MTTADIFLSYNREDQRQAKLFADAFAAAGLNVWWDTALRSGEAYDEVTEAALRAAKAVVVLWSPRSVVSRWVRAEATIADRCKTLVPVTIEACERPIMFELTQTAELSHWAGDATDKAWLAFLDDVRRMAAKAAPLTPQSPATATESPTIAETLKPGQSRSAPSLAVLPFTNRSSLPEDDIFAEGMVEDVISALSQGLSLRVLGSTVTANLSRTAIPDLAALGRQLGVHYLLEGNVRRAGSSLRVTVQLLEAETGAVIWSARFDRLLSELAQLQEELVTSIAASLDVQVFDQEMERALRKPADITAWEAVMRVWSAYRRWDATSQAEAIEHAKRAVAIAPDYGPAQAVLAFTLADFHVAYSDDPAEARRIVSIAERALRLAPEDPIVLGCAGMVFSYIGNMDEGARLTERAVRKMPGNAFVQIFHGNSSSILNRPEAALQHLKTGERLLPGSQLQWIAKTWQGNVYLRQEQWVEAEAAYKATLDILPTFGMGHVNRALCCQQLGQDQEARRLVESARRLDWHFVHSERLFRRLFPNNPNCEAHISVIRMLYASTEPTA
jgi:TolB-like protein/Flp pilus assembly protein TadD